MPSIVSFHRNVGHAVILIILFSFFYLATPVCRFIHLLSETTLLNAKVVSDSVLYGVHSRSRRN